MSFFGSRQPKHSTNKEWLTTKKYLSEKDVEKLLGMEGVRHCTQDEISLITCYGQEHPEKSIDEVLHDLDFRHIKVEKMSNFNRGDINEK